MTTEPTIFCPKCGEKATVIEWFEFDPGKGLQWNLDEDVDFEFTISRKAQAAAKKAAKKGETSADWGEDEEEEEEEP